MLYLIYFKKQLYRDLHKLEKFQLKNMFSLISCQHVYELVAFKVVLEGQTLKI